MSKTNDISNLFAEIGVDASGYRDLAADNQVHASLERWPLLATMHNHPASEVAQPEKKQAADASTSTAPPLAVEPVALRRKFAEPVFAAASASNLASVQNADGRDAAPLAALFQLRGQSAPPREPAPDLSSGSPSVSPASGLQALFTRLEKRPDPGPQGGSSISLFQRLIRK